MISLSLADARALLADIEASAGAISESYREVNPRAKAALLRLAHALSGIRGLVEPKVERATARVDAALLGWETKKNEKTRIEKGGA